MPVEYDDLVIGAGSTGAVIAARLSEDSERRVLLVEAGPDFAHRSDMAPPLLAAHEAVLGGYNWDIRAYVREPNFRATLNDAHSVFSAASNNARISMAKVAIQSALSGESALTHFGYPVGKVVGGSSSVNGALALRGAPEDYDEWALAGNTFWTWRNVLDSFRALECDMDRTGAYSGSNGPIPIQRTKIEDLHPLQRDFYHVCRQLGFPDGDHNHPDASGVSSIPRNVRDGVRISTAIAYLEQARTRPNLTILANTLVNRVLMHNGAASGAEVLVGGQQQTLSAGRVILCAGAINTPAILMRSGIGDKNTLEHLGIRPVVDLPGVGQNLIDHPSVGMWMVPKAGVCRKGEDLHQVLLRYTANGSKYTNDMQLYMVGSVDTKQFPELSTVLAAPLGMSTTVALGKPISRGRVEIADRDYRTPPRVYLNCGKDPEDVRRIAEGVRLAWEAIEMQPLKHRIERVFAWNKRIIDSDKLLHGMIATFVRGSWHAVGTARMGCDQDPLAVVDQYGSVRGCRRLTVADASIMPNIPRAPTNLTCMMIGERLSQVLRDPGIKDVQQRGTVDTMESVLI